MRPLFYVCLLAFFLQTACVIAQKKLWQAEALVPVESTQARARDMMAACESGEYKGTLFSTLPPSASRREASGRSAPCCLYILNAGNSTSSTPAATQPPCGQNIV